MINSLSGILYVAIAIVCGFILPKLLLSRFGSSYNGIIASVTQFLSFTTIIQSGVGSVAKVHLYSSLSNNDIDKTSVIMKTLQSFMMHVAAIYIGGLIILNREWK